MTQPCDFNGIQALSESNRKLPLNNGMKIVLIVTKRQTEKKVNGQPKTTCRLRKSCGEIVEVIGLLDFDCGKSGHLNI